MDEVYHFLKTVKLNHHLKQKEKKKKKKNNMKRPLLCKTLAFVPTYNWKVYKSNFLGFDKSSLLYL